MENNTIMTPELIEPLLEDMGDSEPIRSVLRNRALEMLTWGEITMGELNVALNDFAEGYEARISLN